MYHRQDCFPAVHFEQTIVGSGGIPILLALESKFAAIDSLKTTPLHAAHDDSAFLI
jgi:hypothetical protein